MGQTGDGELVRQALAGEHGAWAELVGRYRDVTCGLAYHYLGSFEDAQDAAQEAFVHAYCHLKDLRDPDRFAPWLRRTAMNRCADHLRRRGNRLLSLDEVEAHAARGAGELGDRVATRLLVRDALGRLGEKARLTVTLFYLSGYSHAEIARFLEIPVNTVRSRLQHAKRQLREEMMAMVSDVLSGGKPDPGWTRQVAEEAMRRAEEAERTHANGEALRRYEEALTALGTLGPGREQRRLEMDALWKKGTVSEFTRGFAEQADLYERSLAIAGELGDRKSQADKLQALGRAYSNAGRKERPEECYRAALEIYRELGDAHGQGSCLLWLGSRCLHGNTVAQGRGHIEEAHRLFEAAGDHRGIAFCRAILDVLAEVGEEGFPALVGSHTGCDGLETKEGAVSFMFETCRIDFSWDDMPAQTPLSIQRVFWQLSHLRKFLDPSVPAGGGWSGDAVSSSYQPLRAAMTVKSADERVTVPAGTFENCLLTELVTAESGLPDDAPENSKRNNRREFCGTRRAWYAPGVGLVQLQVERGDGSEALIQLGEYSVPGAGGAYLPLAVGNAWAYVWADAPAGYVAKEAYRVTAHAEDVWYLEHYGYVKRPEGRRA